MIRTVNVTRYVTPLREGGSLPAIVEADDDGLYVLKFRGAGQGPRALIAELVAGEIGRLLGLPVPEIVFARLDGAIGRNEPDFEIKDLIHASVGLNLGMDFLPGSLPFDPAAAQRVEADLASAIVWFDAYITNVDRTARNTNMLWWHKRLYLIDHGAALYFHHTWGEPRIQARAPFRPIKDHVLLPYASRLRAADETLPPRLTSYALATILEQIPDEWLIAHPSFEDAAAQRAGYLEYLLARLEAPRLFVEEALHAHAQSLL
jgi:HipA-like kinase